MSTGKVVQVIGAVIDVEFPRDAIPAIYDALKIDGTELTLEVQQQLGDGVVRTIALGSTDGLKRGLEVRATGKPISEIGRASGRERVCQYVSISVVDEPLKKKEKTE